MGTLRKARLCLAIALALAAHTASAQQAGGLPEEAATRAAADAQEAAARAAADTLLQSNINAEAAARAARDAQLQTSINNEATARTGADGVLLDMIQREASDRAAADAELRAAIGSGGSGGETSIVGRWIFSGGGTCLSSSTGINPSNLLPIIPPPPPFGQPPTTMILTVTSATIHGVRTFNSDGRGTVMATQHTVNFPSTFIPSTGSFRTGGGSASTLEGTFSYVVNGDDVIIDDDPPTAMITKGASAGAQSSSLGVPRFVGKISKDRRTITLNQEDIVVEQGVFIPAGQAPQFTDRVCERHRTLSRIN